MFSGDIQIIDIFIFAGVAAFLFYRLRGVLGKKDGFKNDDIAKSFSSRIQKASDKKHNKENREFPTLSKNISELEKAYMELDGFDHNGFLEGAKTAFEMIVDYFNKGDKKGLQKLLTKETLKTFVTAIDSGKLPKQKQLLSLEISSVEKVWTEGKNIFIKIKFLSKQIDNEGSGETTKQDLWTFEKNIYSQDPRWLLSSTV